MLSKVTLDDSTGTAIVLHEDTTLSKRALVSAKGLVGAGPLRESKRVRPSAHGGINETKYEDGRVVELIGEVWSWVSIEDALSEFRSMIRPMLETLDVAPALLKWTEGTEGLQLQRLVKLDSDCEPVLQEAAKLLNYQVHFYAEDPRAYSQTLYHVESPKLTSATGGLIVPASLNWLLNPAGGGSGTVSQAGNRPSPLVFRIHGEITNPAITRLSDGARLSLQGRVGPSNYLEVDAAQKTIKLNGNTSQLNFLDPTNTTWSALEAPPYPRSETYILSAGGFNAEAYMDIYYRAAYA